jgi:hypothetical protein
MKTKQKQPVDLKCCAYVAASGNSILLSLSRGETKTNEIYLNEEAFRILFDFVRKELKWKV